MRAARSARATAAVGLAVVLGSGVLAGCRTSEAEEPADEPTSVTQTPGTDEPETPTPVTEDPATSAPAAVNGPNSITEPTAGDELVGPTVRVRGEGTAFEGTLLYRVTPVGGTDVVAEGFTTAGANGDVGPYSFEMDLEPGDYTVQVWEPGMGEGDAEGEPRNLVEVTFSVS